MKRLNFYLAATYSRMQELRRYEADLIGMGHRVTSRWLTGLFSPPPPGTPYDEFMKNRQSAGERDYMDVVKADVVIAFTDPPGPTTTTGGHHTEIGIALGVGLE